MQGNLCVIESIFDKVAGIDSANLIDSEIDSVDLDFPKKGLNQGVCPVMYQNF